MTIETINIPFSPESKRGTWMHATWEEGNPPMIRCPNNHGSVMKNHIVESGGTVKGSVLCPVCGWHVYVKLEDWKQIP